MGVASILLATLGLAACGAYGLNPGRVKPGLERVAVPYFDNQSSEPDIELTITESIIDGLIRDRTLKVVEEPESDAVVVGSVLSYDQHETFFNAERQADEYEILVRVEVRLVDRTSNETIAGPKVIRGSGTYFLDEGTGGEDAARQEAAQEIVQGILNLVIEEW